MEKDTKAALKRVDAIVAKIPRTTLVMPATTATAFPGNTANVTLPRLNWMKGTVMLGDDFVDPNYMPAPARTAKPKRKAKTATPN